MSEIFGYTRVNGNLEINESEAEIVRFYFNKTNEYSDNPPKELVLAVVEDYAARGETLSYEEAAEKVSYERILSHVQKEAYAKFKDFFDSKRREQAAFSIKPGTLSGEKHSPVVDPNLWALVQRNDIATVIAQNPERFSDDPEMVRRVVSILEDNSADVSFISDEIQDEENGEEI